MTLGLLRVGKFNMNYFNIQLFSIGNQYISHGYDERYNVKLLIFKSVDFVSGRYLSCIEKRIHSSSHFYQNKIGLIYYDIYITFAILLPTSHYLFIICPMMKALFSSLIRTSFYLYFIIIINMRLERFPTSIVVQEENKHYTRVNKSHR